MCLDSVASATPVSLAFEMTGSKIQLTFLQYKAQAAVYCYRGGVKKDEVVEGGHVHAWFTASYRQHKSSQNWSD